MGDMVSVAERGGVGRKSWQMWVHDEYFNLIHTGEKTLEVRLASARMRRVQVGDVMEFNGVCRRCVVRIADYETLEMIPEDDFSRIDPTKTGAELLREGYRLMPRVNEIGVRVFELANEAPIKP